MALSVVLGVLVVSTAGPACRSASGKGAPALPRPTTSAIALTALRSPFDVDRRRISRGRPSMQDADVPISVPVTTPMRDVEGVSFYVDDEKSVADPQLKAQNVAALQPLRDYVLAIVHLADAWMVSEPPRPAYAASAIESLSSWAAANALLGTVNQQGAYEREWTLGSLALAYLKMRDAPGIAAARRSAIEAWFRRLAAAIQPNYERPRRRSSVNNHAYWAGMAVAAVGISCNDRDLFDWGLARARIGIAQVDADGVLPLERDRRALALHYHVFALAPLVMLAEMAAANGLDLYQAGDGAIRRLASRVVEAFANPQAFAERMQVAQEIRLPPVKTDLAWAEAYQARFPDPRLQVWLASARPLFDVRLGGSMTAAFAP